MLKMQKEKKEGSIDVIVQPLWGCVRSPFLRRSTPFRALKHLIGLLENTVNQELGGF